MGDANGPGVSSLSTKRQHTACRVLQLTLPKTLVVFALLATTTLGVLGMTSQRSAAPALAPDGGVLAAAAVSAATAGVRTLSFPSDSSTIRYDVRETMLGSSQVHKVVGTASGVSGRMAFDADLALVPEQSRITVDMSTLQTDQAARDEIVRTTTLDAGKYPTSEFLPTDLKGLNGWPIDGDAQFDICGELILRGAQRPLCFRVDGHFAASGVSGTAAGAVSLDNFGINVPQLGVLAAIQDSVTVELDFRAELDSATRAANAALLANGRL